MQEWCAAAPAKLRSRKNPKTSAPSRTCKPGPSVILANRFGAVLMRYDTRYRSTSSLFNWSFPSGVKWLLIANVAIYLVDFFGSFIRGDEIFRPFQLIPVEVVHGAVWQLFTYLFLHSLAGPGHILFNMLGLWMFGAPIEQTWGTRRFLQFYFLCGIGAGACVVVADLLFGNPGQPTIG